MDVGDWLRGLGLGQYEAAFRESEIEADVLAELTDQHLKDLGVSLGNRLRILTAIRELSVAAPAPDQVAARPAQEPLDGAERRQLTVMFGGWAVLGTDFFRYAMQAKGLGYWVDLDLDFIRPIDFHDEYVFGWEHERSIDG